MKVTVAILFAVIAAVCAEQAAESTSAYNYHVKVGIPEAERIRKEEEAYLKGQDGSRIVGGSAAAANQFPYQSGLLIDLIGFNGQSVCGSSLLSANRLITAAHCWHDGQNQAWQFTVILGTVLLFNGGTRVATSDVIIHPEWNPSLILNDVAIIRLAAPVTFSSSIAPIELPSGDELTQTFAGEQGLASGFGRTSDSTGITTAQFLSHVTLNIIENSVCRLAFPLVIRESTICTSGSGGVGTCGGDSGGPLVVNGKLVGVVSFGSALGCQIGFPAAFARVTAFDEFIRSHL